MSVVRENLLTQRGYTPYCGAERCRHSWPRTTFNGKQFECRCGWKSAFEPEFIKQYTDFNRTPTGRIPSKPNFQNLPGTLADQLDKIQEGMTRDDAIAFNDPWWPANLDHDERDFE